MVPCDIYLYEYVICIHVEQTLGLFFTINVDRVRCVIVLCRRWQANFVPYSFTHTLQHTTHRRSVHVYFRHSVDMHS